MVSSSASRSFLESSQRQNSCSPLRRIVALARRFDPAKWREDPILAEILTRINELESA